MRFDAGREHAQFDLNGGQTLGPKIIAQTRTKIGLPVAPLGPPDDPEVVKLVADALCFMGLGVDCYVVRNVYDEERRIEYGAPLSAWQKACKELLDHALAKADADITSAMK